MNIIIIKSLSHYFGNLYIGFVYKCIVYFYVYGFSPEYGVFITDIPHATCFINGYIKRLSSYTDE